jgi:L-rhamnose isomerase/sugar isomerase
VDHKTLDAAQTKCELIDAEECLKDAFRADVTPALEEWRQSKGMQKDPLAAFRTSGYMEKITAERAKKNSEAVSSYA